MQHVAPAHGWHDDPQGSTASKVAITGPDTLEIESILPGLGPQAAIRAAAWMRDGARLALVVKPLSASAAQLHLFDATQGCAAHLAMLWSCPLAHLSDMVDLYMMPTCQNQLHAMHQAKQSYLSLVSVLLTQMCMDVPQVAWIGNNQL